jgi:hypothetical protein
MELPRSLSGDSPKRILQGMAIGSVLTIAIGFNWAGAGFGWTTGGTAEKLANKRADTAVIAVLAPVCAAKFLAQPEIAAKKAAFEKTESWKRRNELPKEWTTLPGESYQNSDLADACSAEILKPKVATAQ